MPGKAAPSDRDAVVYVVREFPKLSESFVLAEVREHLRTGVSIQVFSLFRPAHRARAADPELDVRPITHYAPRWPWRLPSLVAAYLRQLRRRPWRTLAITAWNLRWSIHDRSVRQLPMVLYAAALAERAPPGAVIHAHFANNPTTVALMAGRLVDVPVSFTGHARDLFVDTSPRFLAEKIRRARFIAVGTTYSSDEILRLTSADPDKVLVVRNGVEPQHWSRASATAGALPLILGVARLVPKKGFDTLVEACRILHQQGARFRCEIVGEGPETPRLREQILTAGLEDVVALVGARGRGGVRDALAVATAFALPCRRDDEGDMDNLPLAIIEALAAGVPVVTTPVAGIPEVVTDGVSGLLVPPDDPPALAAALARCLEDRQLRARLVSAGLDAVAGFDVQLNVHRLQELLAVKRAAASQQPSGP